MTAYWPLSIVEHGVGLNITVMSYAGDMGFGFTTARNAVPDARALDRAARGVRRTARAQPAPRSSRHPSLIDRDPACAN